MKYIEIPDFHFDTRWAEQSIICAETVADAASEHNVNFIAIPGDFFNRPIIASDKGGLKTAKSIMKTWLDICPVVAIEGTPSHDAPGSYGIFEEMGLNVLNPGKVYGFHSGKKETAITENPWIFEIRKDLPLLFYPEIIIFGTPELSKKNIQSKLSLSSEEANAKTVDLFKDYINNYVAVERLKHENIPAIMLFHGNVSDSSRSNETDIILKSSDIVVHVEDFESANLTRISLGHIHKPWESEKINAGYAGFTGLDDSPWGKCGFVPAFNLIDDGDVQKIHYPMPPRVKVNKLSDIKINSSIAYWLETEDHDVTLPDGIHPWSRITFKPAIRKSMRTTQTEIEEAKTLWDKIKLFDPKINNKLKEKVDLIEEKTPQETKKSIDLFLEYIKVEGCFLFKNKTIELDFSKLPIGITGIFGENGDGKSSLLSFCHPYPNVIGKDTNSNRSSAIKDFFNKKESKIEKTFNVNGIKHKHLITIKAAHTSSAKTECYLTIDGVPKLDKGTFDEMFTACEELYGPLDDYIITTFYEQPQQAVNNKSGLMSANKTEARNIVQNIAGIDRSKEKRFALDKVSELSTKIDHIKSTISAFESIDIDLENHATIVTTLETEIKCKTESLDLKEEELKTIRKESVKIQLNNQKIVTNEKQVKQLQSKTDLLEFDIPNLIKMKKNLEKNKNLLSDQNIIQEEIDKLNSKMNENYSNYLRLNKRYDLFIRNKNTIEAAINRIKMAIEFKTNKLSSIKKCSQCGFSDPEDQILKFELKEEIKIQNTEMSIKQKELEEIEEIQEPDQPNLDEQTKLALLKEQLIDRNKLESEINSGKTAEQKISEIENKIDDYRNQIKLLLSEIDNLDKKVVPETSPFIDSIKTLRQNLNILQKKLITTNTEIRKAKATKDKILQNKLSLKNNERNLTDWKLISDILSSNKLPSMELEMQIEEIDFRATEFISSFLDSKYSYRTDTQAMGKKKVVDKFDIIIIDNETGHEQSLFTFNPGHKAFFSDCYIKSLISKRNERWKRFYSPVICDEQDAPIKPNRIPMFYNIQNNFYKNKNVNVLVVSQKESAYGYIQNIININDLKEQKS